MADGLAYVEVIGEAAYEEPIEVFRAAVKLEVRSTIVAATDRGIPAAHARRALVALALAALLLPARAAQPAADPAFPAPKSVGDAATLGLGIQRTMTLLATSTPERRNTVRILFYGQSITEQNWSRIVADDLRKRFPHANLLIENRALGGYASQMLVKTAESDLYPFYPDLLIFYVYGAHNTYEDIIRRTRERTTAEILIQTDHVTRDEQLDELTDPAKIRPDGKIWNSFMNYKFLPEVARKYGCGVVDQRNLWKQYLRDTGISAPKLLRDGVHLNAHGDYLMAEFVKAYLVKRDDVRIDPMNCDRVKTLVVGRDVPWQQGGKLVVPFEGNRVDVEVQPDGKSAPAKVSIDGRRPSEFPELYGFSRGAAKPGGKWPPVAPVGSQALRQIEEWTLAARKDPDNDKVFTFSVTGSKTGDDGQGRSDQKFVSRSGRVVIESDAWNVPYAMGLAGVKPPLAEFTMRWNTVPFFADEIRFDGSKQPAAATTVTVAQGLAPGQHTLEIATPGSAPITAIRIYRPTPIK